jgi:hypothetical protein
MMSETTMSEGTPPQRAKAKTAVTVQQTIFTDRRDR